MRSSGALFEHLLPERLSYGSKMAIMSAGGGGLSFLLYSVVPQLFVGGLFLSIFFLFPLFCIGFSWGRKAFMASCGVFLGCLFFLHLQSLVASSVLVTLAFLLVTLALRHKAVEGQSYYYPVGRCVSVLVGMGLIFLCLIETNLFVSWQSHSQDLQDLLLKHIQEGALSISLEQAQQTEALAKTLFEYFWGVCVSLWIVLLLMNASLALRFLVFLKVSLRPAFNFLYLKSPRWLMAIALIILGGLLIKPTSGFLKNACILILLPYIIQGIGVIHVWAKKNFWPNEKKIKIVLGIFYSCVVLFPWILGGVAGLGFLDQGLDLKQRLT